MPDSDQIFIYNDDELSLIKNTFADNDTLLYTIRKVLLQFPLTEVEKGLIRTAVTPAVLDVLKTRILPEVSNRFPLGQIPSILTTLTDQLKAKEVHEMAPQFAAKQLEIEYLTQQFAALADPDAHQPIKLADMADVSRPMAECQDTFINMTAYLFLLGYIDPSLNLIKVIAGEKKETPEEQKKRLTRDSSK